MIILSKIMSCCNLDPEMTEFLRDQQMWTGMRKIIQENCDDLYVRSELVRSQASLQKKT